MSAPQPLTGDELATIKARAEAPDCRVPSGSRPLRCADLDATGDHRLHCPECYEARTTLRLVAEVERLRADNEQGRVNLAHHSEIIDAQAGENDALRTSVAGLKASLGFKQGTIDDLAATVERLEAEAT